MYAVYIFYAHVQISNPDLLPTTLVLVFVLQVKKAQGACKA